MSNETNPQTEQVHQVTTVPPTTTTPVTEKPKRFIKTRNNVRHPIQMVKRNKSAALLSVGAAAGAVSVLLLNAKSSTNDEDTVEVDEGLSDLEILQMMDSTND